MKSSLISTVVPNCTESLAVGVTTPVRPTCQSISQFAFSQQAMAQRGALNRTWLQTMTDNTINVIGRHRILSNSFEQSPVSSPDDDVHNIA